MKAIDFSSKHEIWIRNPDGSLQRMDEPFYESKKIAPGTWMILSDGDYQYLVEGENEIVFVAGDNTYRSNLPSAPSIDCIKLITSAALTMEEYPENIE